MSRNMRHQSRTKCTAKIADVRPAAKPAAGPDTTRAALRTHVPSVLLLFGSSTRTTQEQVLAATAVAELLTTATTDPVRVQKANNSKPTDSEGTAPTVVKQY